MIAVVVEVWPAERHRDNYLAFRMAERRPYPHRRLPLGRTLPEPGRADQAIVAVVLARRAGSHGVADAGVSSRRPSQRPRRYLHRLSPTGRLGAARLRSERARGSAGGFQGAA